MKDLIEMKFELYILEKNDSKVLSKQNIKKHIIIQLLSIFLLLSQFLGILFLSDWLDKNISNRAGVLGIIIGTALIYAFNIFCVNKIIYKYLSKSDENIEDMDVKKILKQHYYSYFLEQPVDNPTLDILKLKYSAEQFETLILSSKNKLPTYAEILAFDEKHEYLQEEKYKVDIENIKKEKILNLA